MLFPTKKVFYMPKLKSLESFAIAKSLVSVSQHNESLQTVNHRDASNLKIKISFS